MTFRKLISSLSAPATVHSRLPPHLLALALRLHTWLCVNTRLWGNRAHLEDVEKQVGPDLYDAHSTIIFDGHLINFLVLIRDVLSYAERSTLDLAQLWETLDTMVATFSITQPTVSASARSRFEEVHADVHECLYVHDKVGTREGPNKISLMPVSSGLDDPEVLGVGGLTSNSSALRVPSKPHKVGATVQRSLPTHAAERYRRILEFLDRVDKGSRLAAILYVNLNQSQPSAPELFSFTDDLHLRHDEVYSTDPFDNLDVLRAFLSALPTFDSPTRREKARDTVGKMITADGLFSNISEHLDACRDEDMPEETRESTSMMCLEILEQVFMLFEGSRTVRWYEFGVDAVLIAVNNVAFSQEMVGNTSGMHAYCVLGIMLTVDDHPPAVQNPEEQLFVLMLYDWLCLGNQPERERREGRLEGDPETSREAASPRYLRSLLTSGPLQNFSILAFHMVPHLKEGEDIPDIVWSTLRELMDVPGLADADDEVALQYFGVVRKSVRMSVVEEEGDPSQEQLDLLGLVNTVAESLSLPELPMPNMVITPDTPPGENTPPDRSGYAPVYI
ncbi:hypothetical protein BC826DRAFT_1024048 [Russula brevipes]|nr:hypothetical protein BC826DRAFT_1024048 [Russula brevipes]